MFPGCPVLPSPEYLATLTLTATGAMSLLLQMEASLSRQSFRYPMTHNYLCNFHHAAVVSAGAGPDPGKSAIVTRYLISTKVVASSELTEKE